MKNTRVVAALVAGASLLAPAVADAKRPPHGLYQCYQFDPTSGYLYSGGFKLLTDTKYKSVSGGGGKYSVSGRKVTFKSGPFHDFTGKTGRDQKNKWVIKLTLKSDPNVKETCSHG
jgi:hypothetical protein